MVSSSSSHDQRQKPNSSSSLRLSSLMSRQENVFKKASEFSTLCGIEVCVISYGPDGALKTWPKDREKVKNMARRYIGLSDLKRRKGQVGLTDFKNQKKKVKHVPRSKFPDWDPRFDNYSIDQLTNLMNSLEHNRTRIQTRFHDVVEAPKQNMNMAYEEQRMMTSTSTMNPLQHHPNQVSSMYLDIYGNPQIESGFNQAQAQAQSLPLLPVQHTNYPNSDVGYYSGLLEGQDSSMDMLPYSDRVDNQPELLEAHGTSMNEFQSTNFNNISVEEYQWLLDAAAKGIELQNMMDMSGYNGNNSNTNGVSHQLPPLPSTTGFSSQPGHNTMLPYGI